ncbi:MAG: cation acetate symporter [Magnetococcales bacterium]|nr:cation acetate symporter [Magnetococcales bacterium]
MGWFERHAYLQILRRYFAWYLGGFVVFVLLLAIAEQLGLPHVWIGYTFMLSTIVLYAGVGVISRTADIVEYYVAGRRIPALFNGMATGADWMSAASFIGMAGALYLSGFDGLAFVTGWTGGYVLVALFVAPYLRKFGQFTIPDFLGARYEGNVARVIGVIAVILVSFTYVVAQIYGVGLIFSRFLGLDMMAGIFAGLAGILVCSFLGGMRAVTWTQVAQYVILIVAYMVPVVLLSWRVTGTPLPQMAFGKALQEVTQQEQIIFNDTRQQDVLRYYAQQAAMTEQKMREQPTADEATREQWSKELEFFSTKSKPPRAHATPFQGESEAARDTARNNYLALVFCLMVGTAALPHVLTRYYTTTSVRETRVSVFWSIVAISLLYVMAPTLAVLAKHIVYSTLIGSPIAELPAWVTAWGQVGLIHIDDVNQDGLLQLAELTIDPDVIVLAAPEMAGLPYVVSGLVAAGGLAAALSTADGLLLTIANALSHDVYFKMINPSASTSHRITLSKTMLLLVAVVAAYVASLKPGQILSMVAWAFSIASSVFFPALTLGIFWQRANKWGAVTGMLVGMAVTLYYLVSTRFYGMSLWFGIQDTAAGLFGVPAGFLTIVLVSLVTPLPSRKVMDLIHYVRYPKLT